MKPDSAPLVLSQDRFARFEAIEWWDQARLKNARVLVVGAGALGNEVIKNLALLGIGNLVIVDSDRVEMSNLSRSVLYREHHEGRSKAECAGQGAQSIYRDMQVLSLAGNVLSDVGLGYFRWAQIIVGALDNREARVFVNQACAKVARPWLDGGIDVLRGIVRGFSPPKTACYECTMSQTDWEMLNKRRSCSLLARQAAVQAGTPTTPTTASVIGAIQAQEVVKFLHGQESFLGKGFFFDGVEHASYPITYRINPNCLWHEPPVPIEPLAEVQSRDTVRKVWDLASRRLGGVDALDLSREIVDSMDCPSCGWSSVICQPVEKVSKDQMTCKSCRTECAPKFMHSLCADSPMLDRPIRDLGLPPWDIFWARRGDAFLGLEIAGDNPFVSGRREG